MSTHKSAKWTASYSEKGKGWFRARKKGGKTVSPSTLHKALGAIGLFDSSLTSSFNASGAREVAADPVKRTGEADRGAD